MKLTRKELSMLIGYCDSYRDTQERYIRRIRRNYDTQLEAHLQHGDLTGVFHPDDEIDTLKQNKAESVVIKKKLQIQRKTLCE